MSFETDEYVALIGQIMPMMNENEQTTETVIREANIEDSDKIEEKMYKYAASGDRFILDPSNRKYYDVHLDETGYIGDDMIYPPASKLMDAIHDLVNHPFILFDKFANTHFTVYQKVDLEDGTLPEAPPGDEDSTEEVDYDGLWEEYPELAKKVESEKSFAPRYKILTISDLNKRPVRDRLYSYIADLEMSLSELIKEEYPKSEPLAEIVGHTTRKSWESNNEVPPKSHISRFMNLNDMTRLVGDSQALSAKCGFKKNGIPIDEADIREDISKIDSEEALSRIKKYRNKIIHANRILVRDRGDFEQLITSLQLTYHVLDNISDSYALELEN